MVGLAFRSKVRVLPSQLANAHSPRTKLATPLRNAAATAGLATLLFADILPAQEKTIPQMLQADIGHVIGDAWDVWTSPLRASIAAPIVPSSNCGPQ